ncbi:hypothetical protein VTG60DRAFT_3257 [Thermothelomyces hinnuleus]
MISRDTIMRLAIETRKVPASLDHSHGKQGLFAGGEQQGKEATRRFQRSLHSMNVMLFWRGQFGDLVSLSETHEALLGRGRLLSHPRRRRSRPRDLADGVPGSRSLITTTG